VVWHDRAVLLLLLYAVVAIVLAGLLFLLATRFLPAGEQIAPAVRDEPPWELPAERPLRPEDIDDLRLPVALRGYRFAETDLLLDRLATELRSRDAEIARLRGHRTSTVDDESFARPETESGEQPDSTETSEPRSLDDDER
jgi:hypothetical protein